ncbi:MAG: GNAT family N-acetyltransferase [Aureispira sp.]|nr:GNAT family N-acetyltransferase [Aureispira sp.]
MELRQANIEDLDELRGLFKETIQTVNTADYTPEQIKVWSAGSEQTERWEKRIAEQYIVLGTIDGLIVGMSSLSIEGYLDLMYVHKDYQRQGIAQRLYKKIEQKAYEQQNSKITVDVSITAKPFFEQMGFDLIRVQALNLKGVVFKNNQMQKILK